MKLVRLAAAVAAAAALTLSGAAVSTAAPAPLTKAGSISPRIVGGSEIPISSAPFAAVQLVNGSHNCSSSQISATWILIAKHCIANKTASQMTVRLGSSSTNTGGTVVGVKQALGWSGGDVALLELKTAYQGSYVPLAASNPAIGARGDIYGWGAVDAKPTYKNKLKTAQVKIDSLTNTRYGPSVVERGVDGQALWGDSGGPLIVNGKVVGVCSGPIEGDPGTITGTVAYSSVIAAGSWIKSTSGVSGS